MQSIEAPPTTSAESIEGYRLSPQQKHLWLAARESSSPEGVGSPYRVASAFEVRGELRREALAAAIVEVVARHEILRTRFESLRGMNIPVQVIGEEATLRWALRETGPARHELTFELPALCGDRAGLRNVALDVFEAYGAGASARSEQSEEGTAQYVDLSEWFNELLEHEDAAVGQSFWRQQELSGLWRARLPFEPPLGEGGGFAPRAHAFGLDEETANAVVARARESGVPPSVFLLACWGLLLHRLSQQPDVVVGVFHDGRKYDGLAGLPGLFGRYVPTPCRIEAGDTFASALARVGEAAEASQRWQEYFAWEHLGGSRPQGGPNFFPYAFEHVGPQETFEADGVSFHPLREEVFTDRFRLQLRAVETAGEGLSFELHYDSAVYAGAEAARLAERFVTLLRDAVSRPGAGIGELDVVGEREREELVRGLNRSAREYPQALCLHELFEEQAKRTPEATALIGEGGEISYAELNGRAERLAAALRRRGVGPESRVGIMLERSAGMVAALLGVLKAGGAYVPVDTQYPRERAEYMLADAGVRVLLTEPRLAEVNADEGARPSGVEGAEAERPALLTLDELEAEAAAAGEGPAVRAPAGPDNLAYVIYTSGSTGRPKGVMVTHASVHNFFRWMQETYRLTPDDRVLLKSPLNFDPSVWELFWPLMVGASVVVARPGGHIEPTYLVELIRGRKVSMAHFVPSMAQVFLETQGLEECASLRRVVCGGEALPPRVVGRFYERLSGELHNSYGPTETTVAPLDYECTPEDRDALNVPIGRPISNSQIYLLDGGLRPVPFGVPGELCVGGASLARGYLGRPGLTGEKFVPDPFSEEPGARMYRTGDLARHLADGRVEFLGRIDHQVKVRGNRIEPGEIESVLGRHAAVRESVVMLREDTAGEPRLVAYVAADADAQPSPEALREHLRRALPEYMIPAAFVVMERLPLAVNGKVDRGALPAPGAAGASVGASYVGPQTEAEKIIAEVWCELLGLERVGVNDNFFDLGGHSLMAVAVNRRLRAIFKRELSVVDMFKYTTVAALAAYLTQVGEAAGADEGHAFEEGQKRGEARKDARARQRRQRGQRDGAETPAGQ